VHINTENSDWNPALYLKYNTERIQPSIDLISRIDFDNPKQIIDIGCGPGNSTQILVNRWPHAHIVGVDSSRTMIETAKRNYPHQEWIICDAGKDSIKGKYDIVFSNATIQWIPNHAELFKKFCSLLNENGLIAIQIPMFWDMPLAKAIAHITENNKWAECTRGVEKIFTIHNYVCYYDLLKDFFNTIDMWETHYLHIMESHFSILEMIRSTGLRPYLERLTAEKDKKEFKALVLKRIESDYPLQKDGKVIFPFKRLFFIAKK
jgi:trans-aconitate 2-methyltransferase